MAITPKQALIGLTLTGGAAGAGALVPYILRAKRDYKEAKELESSIKSKLSKIAGAALAGAALTGAGGYAGGKLKWGTYDTLPKSENKPEAFRKLGSGLFGRTGAEHLPTYGYVGNARDFMREANSVARENVPSELLEGIPDYNRGYLPQVTRYLPDKQSYMNLGLLTDKLGLSMKAAIPLGLASATGLALGGHALAKKKLKPWSEENKKKLKRWQTLDKWLLPGALTAGALLGGIGGTMWGKHSGQEQLENYKKDIADAEMYQYYGNELNRRTNAYERAKIDLARQYMNEDDYGRR